MMPQGKREACARAWPDHRHPSCGAATTNTTAVFSIELMNSNEFKRWLLKHADKPKTGTVEGIKKRLGLKGE